MTFTKAARPVIMGANGVVSCGHPMAALAGINVLREGGNAVDAALAAAFVMSVVKPEASGPGGDLFALVYMKKTGKVEAINSSGPAPAEGLLGPAAVVGGLGRGAGEEAREDHLALADVQRLRGGVGAPRKRLLGGGVLGRVHGIDDRQPARRS